LERGVDHKHLGAFAGRLGLSNFNLSPKLKAELPKSWTGLKLKRKARTSIMDKYSFPDNYPMEVSFSDGDMLTGLHYKLDLAFKKSQLCVRDILTINFNLLGELEQEEPDLQKCFDTCLEATMMAVHQAGALQEDRKSNVAKNFKGGFKRSADAVSITDEVDLAQTGEGLKGHKFCSSFSA